MTITSNSVRSLSILILGTALVGTSLIGACAKKQTVLPAPDPRRPKQVEVEVIKAPTDCEPTDPDAEPRHLAYGERSIDEAKNLADQGFNKLETAEDRKVPKLEREQLVTDAVDLFITALAADPYNVHATYNLAAAYARIDRPQCAINLLERMVGLRKLRSQKDAVESKLDRLLGRGKFRRKLDPDFRKMRDMDIFRDLIKKFCPALSKGESLDKCS